MLNIKGQIIVPALLIFPSLALMAILIVELARLSQQKVLMQFAMDTSVFMEASQLSDLANRLAYLNSPWPTRVFQRCGDFFDIYIGGRRDPPGKAWEYLRRNGAYPPSLDWPDCVEDGPAPAGGDALWQGGFNTAQPAGKESDIVSQRLAIGQIDNPSPNLGTLLFFAEEDLTEPPGLPELNWETAMLYYHIFYESYGYFYRLARMVTLVYEKLHGVFFKKTFWLNTGFKTQDNLVPPPVKVQEHCTERIKLWYNQPQEDLPGNISIPAAASDVITPAQCTQAQGLYQLSTIDDTEMRRGLKIMRFGKHHYEGPPNYFGVNYRDLFNGEDPYVTASAEISGGRVWPKSKPIFQVRLRP